jgi:hypothetical protein
MSVYIIKCIYHIGIGVFLFLSFKGLNRLLNFFLRTKNYYFSYPTILTVYFFCSYFFFLTEKKLLILFTLSLCLYYLHDKSKTLLIKKKYFRIEFLTGILIFLSVSLILGKLIHGPEKNYTAFGLLDTYYYVSLVYQDNVSYFTVKNNNIFGYETSVFRNVITFLGNQFAINEYFDPFYFISTSLLIFSILALKLEIINLKINIKNSLINQFLILLMIFSLPYPLYFFETPILLVAMPILPNIAILILNFKNIKSFNFFSIFFSILISKLAFLSFFFFSIIKNFFFRKKNFIKNIIFVLLSLIFLNQVIPLQSIQKFYFNLNKPNFDFLNFKINFAGFHSAMTLLVIIFLSFFIKKKFFIFYFLPSVFIYIFFLSSSPGQIFYLMALIILTDSFNSKKIFRNFNSDFYSTSFIFLIGIFSIGLGFFYKIDFYLYLIYFIIYLFVFSNFNFIIYKILNFFLAILILLSLNSSNFKQDDVLTLNQKEVYLELKKLTKKEDTLIFTNLNLTNDKLSPPWGLYSAISERQFYVSSFYNDYYNIFSEQERNKMYKINNDIIFNNKIPLEFFKDFKNQSFYILKYNSDPINNKADLIFKNKDYTILKFR